MKIRLLFAHQEGKQIYNTGETPDLPDDVAKKLISEGRAEHPPKKGAGNEPQETDKAK